MSDIRIDLDRLDSARARLDTVITEFDATSPVQAHLAGATGHPRLISVVDDFRSAWSVRRGEMVEELTFLRDAVQAIHDTFVELDQSLADQARYYGSRTEDE